MINNTKTWKPAFLPRGKKSIKIKWLFHRKSNSERNVIRHHAGLVSKGFTYVQGLQYGYSVATASYYTFHRFLPYLAILRKFTSLNMDVNNAFLNGKLTEELYLKVPQGFYMGYKECDCFLL